MSSYTTRNRTSSKEEEHFLLVSGLPPHWTWQDLKDYVRKYVKNQPGWTEVIPSQRRGVVEGYFRIKGRDDADRAYARFLNSNNNPPPLVHHWELSRANAEAQLVQCNCSFRFSDIRPGTHSPTRSGVGPHLLGQGIMNAQPAVAPAPVAAPMATATYGYTAYAQPQQYSYAVPYSYYTNQMAPMSASNPTASTVQSPYYSASTSGIPVNVRHGATLTESRGIFISNLNYAETDSDLRSLVYSTGQTPVEIKMPKDSHSRCKGNATVMFASKEAAQAAVSQLNNVEHKGMRLRVRLDKETTSVGEMDAPVIVNGSNVYRR